MIKMTPEHKVKLYRALKIALVVFVAVLVANCFTRGHERYGKQDQNQNVISFTGHGEVTAVPDIANINFSIEKEAKTVKEAQAEVAKIEKQALDFLKTNNVAEKDIKTTNASFYPKYEYQYKKVSQIACIEGSCPVPVGNSVIVGYTASESIAVKVRNTDDVGKIIEGLGGLKVSNLNGPNFAIDKEDALKDSARKLAIIEAKSKAKVLAKDLGVRLGKITAFSENGNYPMPMYAKAEMAMASDAGGVTPVIPKGENLITSDVTITYEIR